LIPAPTQIRIEIPMQIQIDGQPQKIDIPNEGMEPAVQAILRHCADEGRVVIAIRADGEELPEFEGPALAGMDISKVEVLVAETDTIESVAGNILRSSAESIPQLIDEFSAINQDLQSRNVESGLQRTEKAVTFWISIVEGCLKSIILLQRDLDSTQVTVSGPSGETQMAGNEVLQKINALLEDTQTAFENQDNLEIGDIFEYDIPPLLRAFQQVLFQLAENQ